MYECSYERLQIQHRADHPRRTPAAVVGRAEAVDRGGKPGAGCITDGSGARYGVSSGLLYAWRKALLAAQPNIARFARVEVAGSAKPIDPTPNAPLPPPPAPVADTIEIVLPNRTIVRVDAQIDPRALRRVLSVLAKP